MRYDFPMLANKTLIDQQCPEPWRGQERRHAGAGNALAYGSRLPPTLISWWWAFARTAVGGIPLLVVYLAQEAGQ
jgi:hypothetical protein